MALYGALTEGALLAGMEEGFFAEKGLEIEPSVLANPAAAAAAAQSGHVDIAFMPTIPLLNALAEGVPLHVVAGALAFPDGAADADDPSELDDAGMYASPSSGITSVEDLDGKTIAVPARRAYHEVTASDALMRAGLDPATDVEGVVLDFASTVTALASGTVDAAVLSAPFTIEAENAGAVYLASPAVEFFGEGVISGWVTGEPTLKAESDQIDAFVRAVVRSNEFANENPDVAMQAGLDFSGSQLALDDVMTPYWPTEVRLADLERTNEKLVSLGFLPEPVNLDGVLIED